MFVKNPHIVRQASIFKTAPNFIDGFVLFSTDFPSLIDTAARWYLMDEGIGTNVADSSANGDDATLGFPLPLWTGTPSIDLNTISSEILLPNSLDTLFVGEWTVFIVCKGNTAGQYISSWNAVNNYGQMSLNGSSKIQIGTEDGGSLFWIRESTNTVPATAWYSVAGVAGISGGRYNVIQAYLDGVSETMVEIFESTPHPVPPGVGSNTNLGDGTIGSSTGFLDEMALAILIPSYAASGADITALHAWAAEILAPRGIII